MHKAIASNAFTITIIIILFCSVLIAWTKSEFQTEGQFLDPVCVQVQSGQTISSVSNMLDEENLIESPIIFRLGASYTNKASLLKAGSYIIPARSSMEEIISIVTRGGQNTCGKEILYQIGLNSQKIVLRDLNPKTGKYFEILKFDMKKDIKPETYKNTLKEKGTRFRIIIAEGISSWQIMEALTSADFLTEKVKRVPKEGSLAPSSYEVSFGSTREALIKRMEDEQYKILTEEWKKRDLNSPLTTPEEALILASIIEKETGLSDERGIVASVFINRLRKGMRLQTDPAVIYGLTKGKRVLGRGLKRSELILDTPFNTYINSGLPPTPIANPGKLAIQAALNPFETKYLFFVADGTGGHAFAEDLKTHNKNVFIWRSLNKNN